MNKIKLAYPDITFELTRWCNMFCSHCIRGDRKKLRIKKEYIVSALSQFSYISTIGFSGGEPTLALDLLEFTLDTCLMYHISVGNFYMATNGSIASKRFFDIVERWLKYCDDNEVSGLRVSEDRYHEPLDDHHRNLFNIFKEEMEYQDTNVGLSFYGAPNNPDDLVNDGRAVDNYNPEHQVEHELRVYDNRLEGVIYINALGNVLSSSDLSYATQDKKEFKICHVSDNIEKEVNEWFGVHPELVYK